MNDDHKVDLPDFDFGFTTITEVEYKGDDKAQQIYDAIIPLLNNLAKDGDKSPYIHWPNRTKKITEFKKKITTILNG